MQQLMFLGPHKFEWQDHPAPSLTGGGDAIVRPLAVTTCDLDVLTAVGESPLAGLAPFPFGHEFIAEVVEVADDVADLALGDRVIVPFQISCGTCDRCRRGLSGSCKAVPPLSMFGFGAMGGEWGGALSDLVRVPFAAAMLVKLPEGLAPETVASLSDNIPDAWRTVAPQLAETPGADVLIVGGGANSIPLYAIAIAKALGAGTVDYYDTDSRRLAVAERLGATVHDGPLPKRAGEYPISVDASASSSGLCCALSSLEPDGICTSIGIYYDTPTLPLLDMYTRGVRFHTSRANARADIPGVLELLTSGKLETSLVSSEVLDWEDAAEALAEPSQKPVFLRKRPA